MVDRFDTSPSLENILVEAIGVPKNRLLATLAEADLELLRPFLETVELPVRFTLFQALRLIRYVYFLDTGFASIVAKTTTGASIEVGIVGREGMVGVPVILGQKRSPHESYMQVAGRGVRMPADELWTQTSKNWTLADCLLKFAYAFLVQVTHSALSNGRFSLEQRLARWLLMAHDRVEGNDVALTHEFLFMMLGVRRPGVTSALHSLEGQGAIRSIRGHVIVRDRKQLEQLTGGCYGQPESELAHVGLSLSA
jgi:CRP-like cAMP-binding protein